MDQFNISHCSHCCYSNQGEVSSKSPKYRQPTLRHRDISLLCIIFIQGSVAQPWFSDDGIGGEEFLLLDGRDLNRVFLCGVHSPNFYVDMTLQVPCVQPCITLLRFLTLEVLIVSSDEIEHAETDIRNFHCRLIQNNPALDDFQSWHPSFLHSHTLLILCIFLRSQISKQRLSLS